MSMLKQIQSGLSKFLSKKWIPIIVILVICFGLMFYSSNKAMVLDRMTDFGSGMGGASAPMMPAAAASTLPAAPKAPMMPAAAASVGNQAPILPAAAAAASNGYAQMQVANPSELLPMDKNSQWATLNPSNNNVAIPDLLQAGYHIGLDTIGQTLKNANYQLRSDPIIEKKEIGPWQQSTIEPDFGRVPLEVGYGQR